MLKETGLFSKKIALTLLEIEAIKLNSKNPFIWASGYRMPIYNDNRLLLRNFEHRKMILKGFNHIIKTQKLKFDVIAGIATAGIPHSITLANDLQCPVIYVREKPKDHGMKKQIEGILLKGEKVLVIEDLVSTGGSLLKSVNVIRNEGGIVNNCLSIFSYDFKQVKTDFDKNKCQLFSLLNYNTLLEVALDSNHINKAELKILEEWQNSPFEWGKKYGFNRINRS